MKELTKELKETLTFMIDGLHAIITEKNGYNIISLSKKSYKGSYVIVKEKSMWYNNTSYLISDKNVLEIQEHVKCFYRNF